MTRKAEYKAHKALFTKWLRAYNKIKVGSFRNSLDKQKQLRFYKNNTEQMLKTYPFLDTYTFLINEGREDIKAADRLDMNILTRMPKGWLETIGFDFCEDMRKAAKKDKALDKIFITDLKEKYGTLRVNTYPCTSRIDKVVAKYEDLSTCYCIKCGKPVRYISKGTIAYLCEECFRKELEGHTLKEKDVICREARVSDKNIPERYNYHYIGKLSFKKRYKPVKDKFYKKMWNLQ